MRIVTIHDGERAGRLSVAIPHMITGASNCIVSDSSLDSNAPRSGTAAQSLEAWRHPGGTLDSVPSTRPQMDSDDSACIARDWTFDRMLEELPSEAALQEAEDNYWR